VPGDAFSDDMVFDPLAYMRPQAAAYYMGWCLLTEARKIHEALRDPAIDKRNSRRRGASSGPRTEALESLDRLSTVVLSLSGEAYWRDQENWKHFSRAQVDAIVAFLTYVSTNNPSKEDDYYGHSAGPILAMWEEIARSPKLRH
jgi:hypothetical protein